MLTVGSAHGARVAITNFERFRDFSSDLGRFSARIEPFQLDLKRLWGSPIAGRATASNVDNMLSVEHCKCWNMLNVDRLSKCCGQYVEHFSRGLETTQDARSGGKQV